jgi:aromatic amino acid aminotransferase I / 2-aminoadipate transaminase
LLSCGNTDALYKIFNMVLDPGDFVLVEEFTYPSALASLRPLRVNTIGVKLDSEGILESDLLHILTNWRTTHPNTKYPKLIYTVPYVAVIRV